MTCEVIARQSAERIDYAVGNSTNVTTKQVLTRAFYHHTYRAVPVPA